MKLKESSKNFFKMVSYWKSELHALEPGSSLVHLKLISIQPFVDGNSRLSRLLMNWIFMEKGIPFSGYSRRRY